MYFFVTYVFLLSCLCILIVMYVLFCIFCLHRANWHSSVTMIEVLPCFFLTCRALPRCNSPRVGTTRTLPELMVLFYGLFVRKCVLYYRHRASIQLQLTNISISIMKCIPVITIMYTKHSDVLLIMQTIINWGKLCTTVMNVICIFKQVFRGLAVLTP